MEQQSIEARGVVEEAKQGATRAMSVARHMHANEGTGPSWGIEIEAAEEGYARVGLRLTPQMLNGFGTAHGAMIFAVADTAFAYACNSRNVKTIGQSCTMSFLDPGRPGERLVGEAREVALRGRSAVYEIVVRGEDARVIATMQALSRAIGGTVMDEA